MPSNAIGAYARKGLSSTKAARPVDPLATQVSSSEAAVTVSGEAHALAACAGGGTEQKVAALKQRICDGEYRVNPQILAMRILDSLG